MNYQQQENGSHRLAAGVKVMAEAELLTVFTSGFAVNICLSGDKNLFCLNSISPAKVLAYISNHLRCMI